MAGWRVFACVRTPAKSQKLADLARDFSGLVTMHALDVTDHAAIDALARQIAGTPIDLLLNVAGVLSARGFGKSDYQNWLDAFRINALAPMKMAEAFVEHVAASEQKKIVTLSSILGSIGVNAEGSLYVYRSTKAAVNAIMKTLSIDLAPRGIIAVPLHPGWVRTDMGGPRAEIDAETSATGIVRVVAGLTKQQSGQFLSYRGAEIPW